MIWLLLFYSFVFTRKYKVQQKKLCLIFMEAPAPAKARCTHQPKPAHAARHQSPPSTVCRMHYMHRATAHIQSHKPDPGCHNRPATRRCRNRGSHAPRQEPTSADHALSGICLGCDWISCLDDVISDDGRLNIVVGSAASG